MCGWVGGGGWVVFVKFKDQFKLINKLRSAKDWLEDIFDYIGGWRMLIVPDSRLGGWGNF